MRTKKNFNLIKTMIVILCIAFVISPISAFASDKGVIATPVATTTTTTTPSSIDSDVSPMFESAIATLTIYADSSSTSSWSQDGHAYISIKNIGTSTLVIGRLSGIVTGKMVSLGTWGNKSEHIGLWYNLEEYFTVNVGAFTNNASISMNITQSQLTNINNYIFSHDSWSVLNNCSTFAKDLWNTVCVTEMQLGAGIPNTPTGLRNNIMVKPGYVIGKVLIKNYVVYYASGSYVALSTDWN